MGYSSTMYNADSELRDIIALLMASSLLNMNSLKSTVLRSLYNQLHALGIINSIARDFFPFFSPGREGEGGGGVGFR